MTGYTKIGFPDGRADPLPRDRKYVLRVSRHSILSPRSHRPSSSPEEREPYPTHKHVHRLAIHPTDTSEGATIRTLNELAILGNAITGKRHRPKDPIHTHDHKATDPERTPRELWIDP